MQEPLSQPQTGAASAQTDHGPARQRLSRTQRREQLLDVATDIIRSQGTEGLTLITLAQQAGVTKPITYKHFSNRQTLLFELFKRYDEHLVQQMATRIRREAASFDEAAHIFAAAYLQCVRENGIVYEAIIAALKAYPEYQDIRCRMRDYFCDIMQQTLCSFIPDAGNMHSYARQVAVFGAVEAISALLLEECLTPEDAADEAARVIIALFPI